MKKRGVSRTATAAITVLVLLVVGRVSAMTASESGSFALSLWSFSSSGGSSSSDGAGLDSTVGESGIGESSSPSFAASGGILSGVDTDGDGLTDIFDCCPASAGVPDRQGCPVGDANLAQLHIVDLTASGDGCPGSARSCKLPIEGAEIRVFDRNDPEFRATYGRNPDGSIYDTVFEGGIGQVGACMTDATGQCTAGEETLGDYLAIVKYIDRSEQKTVYTGKPKSTGDFADTNGDGDGDLASKDFQVLKVIRRDGTVQFSGGSKMVVTGSFLEVIYPDLAVWEGETSRYVYPFIFTSDSDWTVDICGQVPRDYEIVGVYDSDGNLTTDTRCSQTFVGNETKAIAFDVVETGSPKPHLRARLRVTAPHLGITRVLQLDVPGLRKHGGQPPGLD